MALPTHTPASLLSDLYQIGTFRYLHATLQQALGHLARDDAAPLADKSKRKSPVKRKKKKNTTAKAKRKKSGEDKEVRIYPLCLYLLSFTLFAVSA